MPTLLLTCSLLALAVGGDADGDGVSDADELFDDTDADGVIDMYDADDDGDGIPTIDEDSDGSGTALDDDTDGDGMLDYLDDDDDGDSLRTVLETGDSDSDGTPDYLDADDDGDGVDTRCELLVGVDHLNPDTDGDTILDGAEWFNTLYYRPIGDGAWEPIPADERNTVEVDGNVVTLPDSEIWDRGQDPTAGIPPTGGGCLDPWNRDGADVINALDFDDDGDGFATINEGTADDDCLFPTNVPVGDSVPAFLDFDSDNDGLPDDHPDEQGDTDGDGLIDAYDCDLSPPDGDSDIDGLTNAEEWALCPPTFLDCHLDPDIDDDGVVDGVEAGDAFTKGGALLDTDGDGLADLFDDDDDDDGLLTRDEAGMPCAAGSLLVHELAPSLTYWAFACDDGSATYDLGSNELDAYPDSDADGVPDFRQADGTTTGGSGTAGGPTPTTTTTPSTSVPPTTTPSSPGDSGDTGAKESSGCGCAPLGGQAAPSSAWLLLGLLALGRRRAH